MSSAVGIVSQVASVASAPASASAPAAVSTQAPVTASSLAATAPIQNPRVVFDPVVGLITQQYSSGGAVISQFPSTAAVNYLREGLDADGLAKQTASPQSSTFA